MVTKKRLRKFGSRLAFEFFLETFHGPIIQGLKKYLASITAEDIPAMVREGKFPPLEHLDLSAVGENIEHIEKISTLRLLEFIAEARPDLATEIQKMKKAGAEYVVKLRLHILNRIKHVEFKPEDNIVTAHCDKCDNRWPVTKEEAAALTETDCPFCHGEGVKQEKIETQDEEE